MKILASLVAVVVVGAAATEVVNAQAFAAFNAKPALELVVPAFTDADVDGLVGTLDRLLAAKAEPGAWRDRATDALWQFARRIQAGRLTKSQELRVIKHLDVIAKSRPEAPAAVAGPRRMIKDLTVGKVAPEISGADLDGRPLRLSDYKDKVVVLTFTAEWCGICRSQAPYERFLLDRYDRWPVAVLGVQTGSSRETARQEQAAGPLAHRSWWDEPRKGETRGPIANAWNVIGWPATYVIDGDGIIRFVDVRDEDLLKAVRQLVETQIDRDSKPKRPR